MHKSLARILLIVSLFIALATSQSIAQKPQATELQLTLNQAIEISQTQSIALFRYKNMYLSKYWAFRSYKASRLPGLSLSATPLNYSEDYRLLENNTYQKNRTLQSSAALSLSQNLALTGGTISIESYVNRMEDYENDFLQFKTTPYGIVFEQPLNGYNSFRWDTKIEPLKFEIAKREFIQNLEDLALKSVQYFFNAASAEINVKISETNYQNADTLLRIGKGRFEIGTVTQDELLDLELSFLNAKIDLTKAKMNLRQARILLNSFLRLDENVVVKCILPDNIPNFEVEFEKALAYSLDNNPELLSNQRKLLEANETIARVRSTTGLAASLRANLGVNRTAPTIQESYQQPYDDNRGIGVNFTVPILDWGYRHGQIKMAKSERDVTDAEVQQARIDFEQSILQNVMEFNLQADQVMIAAKADTIAQLGYDVTKQRFMIDKVDVLKLNSARNSLDAAKRNYIDALERYWSNYFSIRRITLFDFERQQVLTQDFDQLIQTK